MDSNVGRDAVIDALKPSPYYTAQYFSTILDERAPENIERELIDIGNAEDYLTSRDDLYGSHIAHYYRSKGDDGKVREVWEREINSVIHSFNVLSMFTNDDFEAPPVSVVVDHFKNEGYVMEEDLEKFISEFIENY